MWRKRWLEIGNLNNLIQNEILISGHQGRIGSEEGFFVLLTFSVKKHHQGIWRSPVNKAFLMAVWIHDTPEPREKFTYIVEQGSTNFYASSRHLKILGARRVTWSRYHTQDLNISRQNTKFSSLGDLAPGICAPLVVAYSKQGTYPFRQPENILVE
jgi:hypothetical protein